MDYSFSDAIIELKIFADRLAEGVGKDSGMFSAKYQILSQIQKGFNTPKILIETLNIAKSNLALACNNMVDEGLVKKKKDDNNRKEIIYILTTKGEKELRDKCNPIELISETSKNEKLLISKIQRISDIVKSIKNS